jgi:hypothetical protein
MTLLNKLGVNGNLEFCYTGEIVVVFLFGFQYKLQSRYLCVLRDFL